MAQEGEQNKQDNTGNPDDNHPTKKKKNKKFIGIVALIVIIGLIIGGYFYIHSLYHQTTNDAQVKSNMTPIIPHVSGYVENVYVNDHDFVKKGDTLFTIEPQDYEVQLAQAKATLEEAKSQLVVSKAGIGTSEAQAAASESQVGSALGSTETAKIKLQRAKNDFERYKNLYENNSITRQKFEEAKAAKEQAEKEVEIRRKRKESSSSQSRAASTQAEISEKKVAVAKAKVESAKALLKKAELDMGYTTVTAAMDGKLSAVDLQRGQFITEGESLFHLVDSEKRWIVANFKETQLTKMKPGQDVNIKVDAYPNVKFKGKVNGLAPATGSRFSLLPPDNATGNFVKTVQRLPVKITFTEDNDSEDLEKLSSGMNAVVDVHTK